MKQFRVYFDFLCPFCYHEWANIRHMEAERGAAYDIEWYSWEMRPEFRGQPASSYGFPEEMRNQFAELGKKVGVNAADAKWRAASYDALRLLEEAKAQELQNEWVDRVFTGVYQEEADMSDQDTLRAWADEVGLKNAEEILNSDRYADVLQEHAEHCVEIGLELIPAIAKDGELLGSGVMTYDETKKKLG